MSGPTLLAMAPSDEIVMVRDTAGRCWLLGSRAAGGRQPIDEKTAQEAVAQSSRLAEVGRREDALPAIEQAVAIRRRLADEAPERFLPDLAMSINNLAVRLADVDRTDEAERAGEEAEEITRGLLHGSE